MPTTEQVNIEDWLAYAIKTTRMYAAKCRHRRSVLDDVEGIAHEALLKARNSFDPDNAKFITHLCHCIRGEVLHYDQDKALVVHIPAWVQESKHKDHRFSQHAKTICVVSYELAGEKPRESAEDIVIQHIEQEEQRAVLARRLATLKPKEREVLELSLAGLTGLEIAANTGMSKTWANYIKQKAIAKLRRQLS